jgi:hypothetical protein
MAPFDERDAMSGTDIEPTDGAGSADAPEPVPQRPAMPRSRVISVVATLAMLLLVAGGWLAYTALTRPLTSAPDTAELSALDARLTAIENEMRPIATAFTSQSETGTIDLRAYSTRVTHLRDLVDSTNGLAATSPDALEVRDLILTGGAQIVDGMNQALGALASDDASAATPAASRVEEGLANLTEARRKLDILLGRIQPV